ncbi:MAG: hypothetical protein ACT4P7_01570 [Gemmatimonadaceae bacterium]
MKDSSAEADAIVRGAIRRRDPVDRMMDALAHSETMRQLAMSRLRSRFPELTTIELVEKLVGERLTRTAPTDDP